MSKFPGLLDWQRTKKRADQKDAIKAIGIRKEKFSAVDAHGPGQAVEFYNSPNAEEQERQVRRAYELAQELLKKSGP